MRTTLSWLPVGILLVAVSTADSPLTQSQPAPTDADIFHCRAFAEPLVPIGGETTAEENAALHAVVERIRDGKGDHDDVLNFLDRFPSSAWRVALLINLGIEYRRTCWFSKALQAFEQAYELGRDEVRPMGKGLVDHAAGQLAELNARLGRADEVETLLRKIDDRPLLGPATEKIAAARESLWLMKNMPGQAFTCGAAALARLQVSQDPTRRPHPKIFDAESTPQGMSLADLRELAGQIGMDLQIARRTPGSEVVVPSIIHWKARHYSAVVGENEGRFVIQDITSGHDLKATRDALDAESSGYFLVPAGPLPDGWVAVSDEEGHQIFGAGQTTMHDEYGTTAFDDKAKNMCPSSGMATYNFHLQVVSLNIEDTPVGYTPPRGPDMRFTITYNQREVSEQINHNVSNLGPKWVCNWIAYLDDDGSWCGLENLLRVHLPGGGGELFRRAGGAYYVDPSQTGSTLIPFKCPGAPDFPHYFRNQPDGSQQVYGYTDDYIPFYHHRRLYMTKSIDPAGNEVHFNYDNTYRLVSVVDAVGQTTTISHLSDNPNVLPDYYLIKKVTDPFGRFAMFEYQNGQLWKIHDTIGITSEFQYAPGTDFITKMITPYGPTTFSQPASILNANTPPSGNARVIQAVDPTGAVERVEFGHNAPGISAVQSDVPSGLGLSNNYYNLRNTFYWDKRATTLFPPTHDPGCNCDVYDFTKAKLVQWAHLGNDGYGGATTSNIKEREKEPFENAVYYTYKDQPNSYLAGVNGWPEKIARVLDDGTTQLSQFVYNSNGRLLKMTDPRTPVGRVTSYQYAANGIDLLRVHQRNPLGESLDPDGQPADKIAEYFYDPGDPPHMPHTVKDAAGQITTYSYNSFGQVTDILNARGENTHYDYGTDTTPGSDVPKGYLIMITGPILGGQSEVMTLRYDSARRVHKVKRYPDEYELVMTYDDLDRSVQIAYPDGTTEQFQYTDAERGMTLDLTATKDRLDRWTYRHYNANRQLDWIRDPLNRVTSFDWCACGSLAGITDPKGNVTKFERDLQSRLTSKIFAFGTPQQQSVSFAYEDTTSRLKSTTDAMNQTTNYLYEPDNNLKQVTYTGAQHPTPDLLYTYDATYNRVASVTSSGIGVIAGTIGYQYHPVTVSPVTLGANRLKAIDGIWPDDTTVYGYDELGRLVNQSINGVPASVHYDPLGRMDAADNPLGHFSWSYDSITSRPVALNYHNGQTTTYGYFDNGNDRRLQTLQHLTSALDNISKFDYSYDAQGTIQSWHKLLGTDQADLTFGYDEADQLKSVLQGNIGAGYDYDLAGNRTGVSSYLLRPRNGTQTQYTANSLNQLDGYRRRMGNGRQTSLVPIHYDFNGNLTDDAAGKTYEWDAANRLVAINYADTGNRTECAYDGLGRRVKITELAPAVANRASRAKSPKGYTPVSTKTFVWSGTTIAEERNETGSAVTKRFFSQGEQRIGGADAGNYYYTRDHLGSIREVTDSSGNLKARYDYDAWGNLTTVTGPIAVDFGYTGHYYHQPSNLNLAMYRAYSPKLGRWLSRDPIGEKGGNNLYSYVANDSIGSIDPDGLITVLVHGTFSSPETFDSSFRAAVAKTFGETPIDWQWSGADTDAARIVGGTKLARFLEKYRKEHPCEKVNIVAHSHGGNVAFVASQHTRIDTLVALGTPIADYTPNIAAIGNLVNAYSTSDGVQGKGGSTFGWFGKDFGPANQAIPQEGRMPIRNVELHGLSHGDMHTVKAWEQIFP